MSHTETFGVHPAELPEIASEDLKAIRGFLPGKLLGRTAALLSLALSLALAYLEYFGPIHGITAVGSGSPRTPGTKMESFSGSRS